MWDGNIAVEILIAAGVLSLIAAIPSLIEVFPSVLDSLLRWKGSASLNLSVSLSRSRNIVAAALVAPFIFFAARYDLLELELHLSPICRIGVYAAIFVLFMLVRAFLRLFKGSKISRKDWKCVHCAERNFFIVLVLSMLLTFLIFYIIQIPENTLGRIFLWEICIVYFIFLIRKAEILYHIRGNFVDILYLCTLEFLPAGLIVVSEILL